MNIPHPEGRRGKRWSTTTPASSTSLRYRPFSEGANFRDLVGRLRGRPFSPRPLQISYIHARRWIKYSFIAAYRRNPSTPSSAAIVVSQKGRGKKRTPLPIRFSYPSLSLSLSHTRSTRYIRVRTLLAITLAKLQIAIPRPPAVARWL